MDWSVDTAMRSACGVVVGRKQIIKRSQPLLSPTLSAQMLELHPLTIPSLRFLSDEGLGQPTITVGPNSCCVLGRRWVGDGRSLEDGQTFYFLLTLLNFASCRCSFPPSSSEMRPATVPWRHMPLTLDWKHDSERHDNMLPDTGRSMLARTDFRGYHMKR